MGTVTIRDTNAKPETSGSNEVIRDVRSDQYGQIIGRCGNVRVQWTFSTRMWFWAGGHFGYLESAKAAD